MPYVKFDEPKAFAGNKGSISNFLNYMAKEDFKDSLSKEFYFNQKDRLIPDYIVLDAIDLNKKGLGKNDAKFYTGSISFSKHELEFIGNDFEKIKDYSLKVMEQYAQHFNKGLTINDINWFAKIEKNRYYKGNDIEVKQGLVKQGDIKPGLNTHCHFIIGHKSADGSKKLSPKTNHRDTISGPITGGFDRDSFKKRCEQQFDDLFKYLRPIEETYQYNKLMSKGKLEEQVQIITNIADDRIRKRGYQNSSTKEKENRIEKLANFICFGGGKSSVRKIDVNLLVRIEKENKYSGHIYRSLINLNSNVKMGKIPKEYDLTSLVITHAQVLMKREDRIQKNNPPKMIFSLSEFEGANIKSWLNDPISNPHFDLGDISSKNPEEVEEIIKRRKKKRGQHRNR